jgi:predicted acyl esterase
MATFEIQRVEAEPVSDTASEHFVRMRDGARLATDVYLPAGGLPTQAVLVRQPYDKGSRYTFFKHVAPLFAERGYALVVQDVRGKFRSGGATVPYVHEVADGFDTIEWVVGQPWCDGRVGMFGDSYYGFTQWAAVASGHPALRAIVPRVTSADLGPHLTGTEPVRDVPWLEGLGYYAHFWIDQYIYDYEPDFDRRPLATVFDEAFDAIGRRSAAFDMAVPHTVPTLHWPTGHPFDARPIPVLHVVGWFDNLLIPSMRDYATLTSLPDWAPLQYLSADSVDHENHHLSHAPVGEENEHDTNDAALERMLPRYVGPALDFYDVFLKRVQPVETLPRVSWHLGHGDWNTATRWPPPEAREQALHLVRGSGGQDGRLTRDVATEPGEMSWTHEPDDLIPSAVANSFAYLADYPDEQATGDRDDVLRFDSEPLDSPLDLAGPVTLRARLRSTAPSADVFVKLLDVDPSGAAHMIVRGQAQADTDAGPVTMDVTLGHTGYRVRRGHRLRLHIASSDFPLYVPNPGTGENPWLALETAPSEQAIVLGGDDPTRVTFWAIQAGA